MARDRAYYIDQSSSLNVHHRNKDNMMVPMTQYICWAWKLGLKTACYYTRTIQDVDAIDFTGTAPAPECTMCSA
jgi:ribonucleotide reductase alpha subunit